MMAIVFCMGVQILWYNTVVRQPAGLGVEGFTPQPNAPSSRIASLEAA